jgi:murein DD-endopeptidase MepM/ murein hydrolase activator NlpD
MVQNNSGVQNPFSYLKSVDYDNDSGGDSFNPTGSWDWPIRPRIDFNQGYGKTWAIANTWVKRIYSFHNGIDISSQDTSVYATHKGTLFRGAFKGGCTLKYVRVENKADNIETYYLHVNYF